MINETLISFKNSPFGIHNIYFTKSSLLNISPLIEFYIEGTLSF